ncbi:hypothetical protein CC78DRAFT_566402 [Lojkania enalia]|uniref:Uncharacterized protein n=1 Tax=Lojkania enalia TaxID=147567 RepID=A0A9P4N284_9PLEO|nr:hypothetical protein CC78DRAFT_566402 [Didymosphaeria enalia]
MADLVYDNVYLGPWVDQSQDPINGAKITLTSTGGAVLIAFLALFVQYVGQHLWELVSFGWHQIRNSPLPKLALQYQQDAALRNNASPQQSLLYFIQIAWAWKHIRKQESGARWWRIAFLPPVIPLMFVILLIAAGILSSWIVDTSNVPVLLRGDKCGLWQVPSEDMARNMQEQFMVENGKYLRRRSESSRIYTRDCYNNTNARWTPSCQVFTQASIPFTTSSNVPCPFNSTTCALPNANLMLDTGALDTNDILGINSKKDSIKFRRTMTCAPIKPDLFTERLNYTMTEPDGTNHTEYIMHWLYGPFLLLDTNATAVANSIQSTQLNYYTSDTIAKFPLDERVPFPDQSTFLPRVEFNRSDGDLQFIFLSGNRILFSEPTDDPWFSAHEPYTIPRSTDLGGYLSDHLASPMGCIEQYQFCNPHKSGQPCTDLAGILPASGDALTTLDLSPMQQEIVNVIMNIVYALGVNIGAAFDPDGLKLAAQDSAYSAWQLPLPNNQWEIEMQHANNIVLANLQKAIVSYTQGPSTPEAQQFIVKPNSTEEKALCNMIRAKSNGRFNNVSTYGLSITLIIGTLLVLINTFLSSILKFLRHRRQSKSSLSKSDSWVSDQLFQLQKFAFATRKSMWRNVDGTVPVTEYATKVERYDLGGQWRHGDVEVNIRQTGTANSANTADSFEEKKALSPTVREVSRMDSLETIGKERERRSDRLPIQGARTR